MKEAGGTCALGRRLYEVQWGQAGPNVQDTEGQVSTEAGVVGCNPGQHHLRRRRHCTHKFPLIYIK